MCSSSFDGGARFCRGSASLRLVFLSLLVAVGDLTGWILVLREVSGKSSCSEAHVRLVGGLLLLCGCACLGVCSSDVLLVLCLCELGLQSGSWGGGWFPSMVEDGGRGAKSMRPTTDVLFPSISCSLTMLGVRRSIWIGLMGGCKILGAGERTQRQRWRAVWRRKMNSRVFVVISVYFRALSVSLRCTVLPVFQ